MNARPIIPFMLYFDHNATTPVHPDVAQAVDEAWRCGFANPESLHEAGRVARRRLDAARRHLADAWSVQPAELVFLSSGTMANQAVLAAVASSGRSSPSRFIASPVEHPSLLDPLERLAESGHTVERLAVDRHGRIDPAELEQLLQQPADLVVIQAANHETGVLQPLDEIGAVCRRHGTPWHLDAVQWVGKASGTIGETGATFAAISAHKFGGPRGIAVLRVGSHESHLIEPPDFPDWESTGTEPLELAIGLEAAVDRLTSRQVDHLRTLRDRLEAGISASFPESVIHGKEVPRIAQTISVAFPGIDRQVLLLALDQRGVACSSGSACRSGAAEPSPTLRAMNLPGELVESTIRISLGWNNTLDQIDQFIDILKQTVPRLRAAS